MSVPLEGFIAANREELIKRCRLKVTGRLAPVATGAEIEQGIPIFLEQLAAQLRLPAPDTIAIRATAANRGRDLFRHGLTIGQVVHDYGDVCQAITELAGELNAPLSTADFRTLNRCLDDAIADAVSEFANQARLTAQVEAAGQSIELRNLLFTAVTAFEALQTGSVGVAGTTGFLVHRSLVAMRALM
jgi:hypothetical protein